MELATFDPVGTIIKMSRRQSLNSRRQLLVHFRALGHLTFIIITIQTTETNTSKFLHGKKNIRLMELQATSSVSSLPLPWNFTEASLNNIFYTFLVSCLSMLIVVYLPFLKKINLTVPYKWTSTEWLAIVLGIKYIIQDVFSHR